MIEYNGLVKKINAIQITDTSYLVQKNWLWQKMVKLKIKYLIMIMQYVTTQEFNKLTADYFTARLRQESVATKADINDFVGNTDYNYKLKNS